MTYQLKITHKMKLQFVSEATEHLNAFEKSLIRLEQEPRDPEALNAAFRAIHGIKGNSDYLGFADINKLSHALEELLDDLRRQEHELDGPTLQVLLDGHDQLRQINHKVPETDYQESDIGALLARIEQVQKNPEIPGNSPTSLKKTFDPTMVFCKAASQQVEFLSDLAERISAGESVSRAQKNIMRCLQTFAVSASYAGFTEIAETVSEIRETIEPLKSVRKKAALFLGEKTRQLSRQLAGIADSQLTMAAASHEEYSPDDILGSEIRIEPEKVDNLITAVSQLIITKNSLLYMLDHNFDQETYNAGLKNLKKTATDLGRFAEQLQTNTMNLRLVRINSLFERLPRLVRDLAIKNDKKVTLNLMSDNFEIDRKVMEHLVEPMLHLLRNAIDHGIESPAQRSAAGKSAEGVITVRAQQEGSFAILEIIDDGSGMDEDKIRKTAQARGLVGSEELDNYSSEEIINLIFLPGFTTKTSATLVSGRGVGLDIVKTSMSFIGGAIKLFSEPGKGSRFTIRVPLSMAVMEVLLVESDSEIFALPFSAVQESLTIDAETIQVLNRREVVSYQDNILELKHIGEIMGLKDKLRLRKHHNTKDLPVVVIAFGGQSQGLVVDRILRRGAVLVKPLSQNLGQIRELSGAALLEDGNIVLVVDPAGIIT